MKEDEVDKFVDSLFRQYPSSLGGRFGDDKVGGSRSSGDFGDFGEPLDFPATIRYAAENPGDMAARNAVVGLNAEFLLDMAIAEREAILTRYEQRAAVEEWHDSAGDYPLGVWGIVKGLLLLAAGLLLIMGLSELGLI